MDHKFIVLNEYGNQVLVTDSWLEASGLFYRMNQALTNVGYEPNYSLWIEEPNNDRYQLELK
jgi:hypothetical protein